MTDKYDKMEEELNDELENDGLIDDIAKRWDPERLLRLLSNKAGKGESLDESTRAKYEKKLGVDLGNVRLYSGGFAEEFTKAHSAEAVTVSNTGMILMGNTPERSMATSAGEALLAHELTHVAQSSRGLHRSSLPGGGDLATDENEAEAEAVEEEVADSGFSLADEERIKEQQGQKNKQILAAIEARVLQLLSKEIREDRRRNGPRRFRP